VLQTGRDIERCGNGVRVVGKLIVKSVMMRNWFEVLRGQMMWRGCIDESCAGGV